MLWCITVKCTIIWVNWLQWLKVSEVRASLLTHQGAPLTINTAASSVKFVAGLPCLQKVVIIPNVLKEGESVDLSEIKNGWVSIGRACTQTEILLGAHFLIKVVSDIKYLWFDWIWVWMMNRSVDFVFGCELGRCLLDDFLSGSVEPSGDVEELHFEQLPFNHPLFIMYSSGTTGPPKCMVHSAGVSFLVVIYLRDMRTPYLPTAYVVRREGNVLTRVCPSICLSTPRVPPPPNQTWPGGGGPGRRGTPGGGVPHLG